MAKEGEEQQEYSVGYKKPPRHTRFQPGKSGNPKGRPKKTPTLNEVFLKELLSQVPITMTDGRKRKISKIQAIAKRFSNEAVNGNQKAARFVLDQANTGKPESGDNLANLVQELRAQHTCYEEADRLRPENRNPKKRT